MYRRVAHLTAVTAIGLALAGCALSFFGFEQRAAWRDQAERACIARREVVVSAFVQPARAINERGACGMDQPLKVAGLNGGSIGVGPAATLNCPMTAAVDSWLAYSVQPAAMAWFGAPVVEIKQISAYACRPINNEPGENLSEHAFGNALDVAGFRLANGRTVMVKGDWNGEIDARSFLREVFAAGCQRFRTALGPGVKYHGDHFHFDLARRGRDGTSTYCKPVIDGVVPQRTPWGGPGDLIAMTPSWPERSWPRLLDMGRTGSVPDDGMSYTGTE